MRRFGKCCLAALLIALCLSVSACGDEVTPPPSQPPVTDGPEVPAREGDFDMQAALSKPDRWVRNDPQNAYTFQDGYLTVKKGPRFFGYGDDYFKNGTVSCKMMLDLTGENCTFGFSRKDKDLSKPIYNTDSTEYLVVFLGTGEMELQKYIGGEKVVLSASSAAMAAVTSGNFFDFTVDFHESAGGVDIAVKVGSRTVFEVNDGTDPILGGGYLSLSSNYCTMVIGHMDAGEYVAPPPPSVEFIEITNVPQAQGTVDLLAGFRSGGANGFRSEWTGRAGIFNPSFKSNEIVFANAPNPEEPGENELQAAYKKYIFREARFSIDFRVEKIGEWLMFWLKNVGESINVSAWGNKLTKDNAQAYTVAFYSYSPARMQVMKWNEMDNDILLDVEIDDEILNYADTSRVNNLTYSITEVQTEVDGEIITGIQIDIDINGFEYQVLDFKDPYLNAGYFGLQGYKDASVALRGATATIL